MYNEVTARAAEGDAVAKRISFTVAAHAPYTVSDASFAKVKAMSEELGIPVHVHLHETHDECHASENGARVQAQLCMRASLVLDTTRCQASTACRATRARKSAAPSR